MMNPALHSKPWYREPWPWLLMSLPLTAVIAGVATVIIAFQTADGLVVGDYYKAGLAINQTLARDDVARAAQLAATFKSEGGVLMLRLDGRLPVYPKQLLLTLAHPTRQGMDQTLTLQHAGGGRYRAVMPVMPAGKWHAQLVDAASTWRLSGVVHTPINQPLTLSSAHPPEGD